MRPAVFVSAARRFGLASFVTAWIVGSLAAQELPVIQANDNRTPAGEIRDGVLYLELEIKKGVWYPESEDGDAIEVYAFGEVGGPLQVPAPTIRVPEGTTIDVSVKSSIEVATRLLGLYERPGETNGPVALGPGETQHVRFNAGEPGTYVYWGRTPDSRLPNRRPWARDALTGGALVVDPAGEDAPNDRIFVLERWNGARRTAINGKSWPYTERLGADVGKEVRWKIVNASDSSHPMHLHGFHFQLEGEGDGRSFTAFDAETKREEFTHQVESLETFEMTWVPKEPGRWLYHCHLMPHMRMPVKLRPGEATLLEQNPDHEHMHEVDSGYAGMGGMVLGLTVTGPSAIDTVNGWEPERRVKMNVGNRNDDPLFYEITLEDLNGKEKTTKSTGLTGPLLVVTEGQQTEITLTNSSRAPTSVHWHGQEIESYYDGVPWWSGIGEKRAPLVEPGHEFRVKIIPQRAGSYMYHAHWHEGAQMQGGVHGPMIVLPPGGSYDPETDKAFIMSASPREPFGRGMLLINGSPQPQPIRLLVGTKYRFRFMNVLTLGAPPVELRNDAGVVEWRPMAKDAVAVEATGSQKALQRVAVGETFDFEYQPTEAGRMTMQFGSPAAVIQRIFVVKPGTRRRR